MTRVCHDVYKHTPGKTCEQCGEHTPVRMGVQVRHFVETCAHAGATTEGVVCGETVRTCCECGRNVGR